ncbi:MAG: hypothetical protein COW85_01025 [Ignavibacteria bacterium CG22_combo_CG10-13_8_21_14_all_37_15]|nr:MAG: hypothetical protein COW85_01025 [Ignavibacteria bacterium CG22_combo_CG10-13_8_21_14_all_37_15]
MKKLTIISLFFLSVQLIGQVNSTEKCSLLQLRNFERTSFSFEEKSQDSLPPVQKGRILSEFLIGNIIGFGSAIPSYLIGAGIGLTLNEPHHWVSPTGVLSVILAYPFAVAYGVYIIGNIGIEEGSYWSTLLGTLGGISVGIGVGYLAHDLDNNNTLTTVALLCPSVGAIIGFNSSRRLETNPYSFKIEQNKYSILKPDYSIQLLRVNF